MAWSFVSATVDVVDSRIVIAGAGVAGLEALIALRRQADDDIAVTLVSPDRFFAHRALGHDQLLGGAEPVRGPDLVRIAGDLGVTLVADRVARVLAGQHRVVLGGGEVLDYDALLLATGGLPYPAFAHGTGFEPSELKRLLSAVGAGAIDHLAIVVADHVGWTLPGYQLALSAIARGRARGHDVAVTVITHEHTPLSAFGESASRVVRALLADEGIDVISGREPVVVTDGALVAGRRWISADAIVALPRLAGPRMPGVPSDRQGFVPTTGCGRVLWLDRVYAAGDATAGPVKQGGLAAQQAAAVADDIRWRFDAGPQSRPRARVLRGVLETGRGPLFLEAVLGPGRAGEGSNASWEPLWSPPARVVTRWLGPYLEACGEALSAAGTAAPQRPERASA